MTAFLQRVPTALFSSFILVAACGGKVAIDSASGTGGTDTTSSGTGGAPTTSTSTTSTSVTTSTGSSSSGGCTGAIDFKVVSGAPLWTALVDCGVKTIGGEPALLDCILTKTGLSTSCAACCDDYVACTIMKCLPACGIEPNGMECVECRKQSCDPGFMMCSGLPLVPHP